MDWTIWTIWREEKKIREKIFTLDLWYIKWRLPAPKYVPGDLVEKDTHRHLLESARTEIVVPVHWAPKGILITQFDHQYVGAFGLPKLQFSRLSTAKSKVKEVKPYCNTANPDKGGFSG